MKFHKLSGSDPEIGPRILFRWAFLPLRSLWPLWLVFLFCEKLGMDDLSIFTAIGNDRGRKAKCGDGRCNLEKIPKFMD